MAYTIDFYEEIYTFTRTTKELHRMLRDKGLQCSIIKWLGYYDIIVPEHPCKSFPTGIKALNNLSIEGWVELVKTYKL